MNKILILACLLSTAIATVAGTSCPMPGGPFVNGEQFPKGGNTNAYCWVDVVVQASDADVVFQGDGPSNLPDPKFKAHAGETNRVILLIGKGYKITSTGRFCIPCKSSPNICIQDVEGGGFLVRCPVYIGPILGWNQMWASSASRKAKSKSRKKKRKYADSLKASRQPAIKEAGQVDNQEELLRKMRLIDEKERIRKERLEALEEARRPLEYDVSPESGFKMFGYVMGQEYPPPATGQKVVYGDVVKRYTPQYVLPEQFHGMKLLFCELAPISKRIFSMSLYKREFPSRAALMKEGLDVLDSLGKMLGYKLAPFKYEAPDWPHWPCGAWSGPIPELFVADENQWATSKNVFAVSNTKIGKVSVKVKLDVVSFQQFALSVEARDDALASEAEQEFDEDFKKKHDGKIYAEWWKEQIFISSPEYKKNEKRQPLPSSFKLAGIFLDEEISPDAFAKRFRNSVFFKRETNVSLPEKFIGVFSRIGVATNSLGRISTINLESDIMKNAEQAASKYVLTREFMRSHGMDDYYEEVISPTKNIQDFYDPEKDDCSQDDPCDLKWIDKSRSISIELALQVKNSAYNGGMQIFLTARQVAQNWTTDYQWERGMRKIRTGNDK